jgi:hypothetical protein
MTSGERPEGLGGAEGTVEGGGIRTMSDRKDEARVEAPEAVVGGGCVP